EAVANAVPVIATDLYAIPEVLGDGYVCIAPPLQYYDATQQAVEANWTPAYGEKIKRNVFLEFETVLYDQVVLALDPGWRENAGRLLRTQYVSLFSEAIRVPAFEQALGAGVYE